MKTIFLLLLVFLGYALFPFFSVAIPHENEVEKSKKVSYSATAETLLQLKNQFGQIHIEPGPEDEIAFRADFRAWASSKEKAHSILERLSIEHGKEDNIVYFHTVAESMGGEGSGVGFEINYAVIVPPSLALEIENKFGHVFLEEHRGALEVHLEHGNLHAEKLVGKSTKVLHVKFGNLKLDEVENVELAFGFGNLDIQKATGKLHVKGSDGRVEIEEAQTLEIELKRGALEIERIAELEAEVAYGTTEIEEVTHSLELESKYGGCEIERIASTVQKVDIECDFGSVKLGFTAGLRVNYDVECSFGTFKNALPAVEAQLQEKASLSEKHKGQAGKGKAVVEVNVEVKHGNAYFLVD
jgi:hypothetical protein